MGMDLVAATTSPAQRTLLLFLFGSWLLFIVRMGRSSMDAKSVPRLLKRIQPNLTPAEYRYSERQAHAAGLLFAAAMLLAAVGSLIAWLFFE